MKAIFLFASASVAIFKLASSSSSHNYSSGSCCGKKIKPPPCRSYSKPEDIPSIVLRPRVEKMESLEPYKSALWEKWFSKKKKEMLEYFQEEKNAWLQHAAMEWGNFLNNLENKWMHYNPNMKEDYNTNLNDVCANWSDSKWRKWFKIYGVNHLKSEYVRWFNNSISDYNITMTCKLIKWYKKKKYEFDSHPEYIKEKRFCKKWKNKACSSVDPEFYVKTAQYNIWNSRHERERKEWLQLINEIYARYVAQKCTTLRDWGKCNVEFYKDWIKFFYEKWLRNEQWKVWLQEKNMDDKKNTENVENTDNVDNLDNTDNMDNIDNTDNMDNIDNTDNMDNIDNTDNMDNLDNVDNMDNLDNTDNMDNLDIVDNMDNIDNTDNMDNLDIVDNMDHIDNKKNKKKKKNKKN
ncbi:tryptophan-rich antigen (Pv-fam-a) [Plasmodium malariae]|uniref:Tryptophan-rich antigen (Pv-fam-a) n=1 Tax=Plasmodium malariae TaxID=5858 RepID=A0A1A8WP42_PLAMA|nr:tryptophan-rich antigen (Pv-fam-a) [Plasmodium malariae]